MKNKMKLIIATTNHNKVKEIREMLKNTDITVSSLSDEGIDIDIIEDGTSFEENAMIKAKAIANIIKDAMILADDSGLVIDALDGAPGIHSSRFMGEETSYDVKCKAILDEMKNVPDEKRNARFICSMALIYPDGNCRTFTGCFEGMIAHEAKGDNGFGYDPIFYVPDKNMTSAQMSPEEKNTMSHRSKALKMVVDTLKNKI